MGLGRFRVGTFCGLGRFGVGTFCRWDVLELGPFVLGRFVLGRFVGAPRRYHLFALTLEVDQTASSNAH